jgi:hypothetical protein
MTTQPDAAPAREPASGRAVPLNYGHKESCWRAGLKRAWADAAEIGHGLAEFLGHVFGAAAHLVGGPKQLICAIGSGLLAAGLGIVLQHGVPSSGPLWMALGGFCIGSVVPVEKSKKA